MARITLGDDLDGLITRFEDLVVRVLRSIAASAARLLGGTTAAVPAGHVSVDDLGVIRVQWAQHLDAEVLPAVAAVYRAAAGHVADRLAYFGHDVAALTTPDAAAFLAGARNRLVGVGDHLWQAARDQLVAGMQAGEGVDQLAARVRDAAGVSQARALVIARTEVTAASNAAALAQVRVLGDPSVVKEWMAVPGPAGVGCDERTRPTHCKADGQRVRIGERFEVGEALLDHPGDPTGPPEEVVSCRCAVAVDLDDEPVTAAGRYDEAKHPRDRTGKFAKHPGGGAPAFADRVEAAATGDAASQAAQYQPSNDRIRSAIDNYGGEGPTSYQAVNSILRGSDYHGTSLSPQQQATVDGLDEAMNESGGLPQDIVSYRFMDLSGPFGGNPEDYLTRDLTGLTWRDDGFVSTGTGEEWKDAGEVVLRILIPKGTPAIAHSRRDVPGDEGGLDADEVLLGRGLTFRVVADHGHRRTDYRGQPDPYSGRDLDVEVVPS
jgi:hypothetical protein